MDANVEKNANVERKWYKTIAFWGIIIPVVGGFLIAYYTFFLSRPSDFVINVTPIAGEILKGGLFEAKIVVEGQDFDGQIRLATKSQSDKIDISFDPPSGTLSSKFESKVTIRVANEIEAGNYEIEIIGVGSKNKKEHSTKLFLKVNNKQFAPQNMTDLFFPDGYMGKTNDIQTDYHSTDRPFSGGTCIKIRYRPSVPDSWSGIYWLYPNKNWGNTPIGRNLNGANYLSFRARGARGGEKAEFKIGGVTGKYEDSIIPPVSTDVITLKSDWKEYKLDLNGKSLNNVFGGFCWVTNYEQNPQGCEIYLDEIVFH